MPREAMQSVLAVDILSVSPSFDVRVYCDKTKKATDIYERPTRLVVDTNNWEDAHSTQNVCRKRPTPFKSTSFEICR